MIARPEDEPELLAYFDASPDETIWLRSSWYEGGARFALHLGGGDGRIVSMAAQDRNGVVQVHASEALEAVVRECLHPGTTVVGIAGPPTQIEPARIALGQENRTVARMSHEIIMALDLDAMVVPDLLAKEGVISRRALPADVPLLVDWRQRYFREVHAMTLEEEAAHEVRQNQANDRLWVLEVDGAVVNTACFSQVFPHLVQIEYAYGPPELRAKKYGRSVVAGALVIARDEGIQRAVFNTDVNNVAVQTGIHPIGFRKTGDYWVMLLGPVA